MSTPTIKQQLIQKITDELHAKAEEIRKDWALAKESRDNDTKSSAGDKFETGREMMQIEINKSEVQLHKTLLLINEVEKINTHSTSKTVRYGSIVQTNLGNYFLAVPFGKTILNNTIYFAISLASPIAKALQGKHVGDEILFQGNKICISKIN